MKYLPKLTMRDLLWLIVVVALGTLWWNERNEVTYYRRQLRNDLLTLQQQIDLIQQRIDIILQRQALSGRASP